VSHLVKKILCPECVGFGRGKKDSDPGRDTSGVRCFRCDGKGWITPAEYNLFLYGKKGNP